MYFSKRLIQSLILDLALEQDYRAENALNLLYHLSLPGWAVPFYCAEVIAGVPEISMRASRFPERLAYGVLEDGLLLRDLSSRNNRQVKLFRKINLIRLGLCKLQYPDEVVERSRARFAELRFASESFSCLAADPREPTGPELGAMLETVIESAMRQTMMINLLLERLTERCNGTEKHRLLRRAEYGIESGLDNEPLEEREDSCLLVQLDDPVRFREELLSTTAFRATARSILSQLTEQCR